ncbi:MAG TPA: CarD family transcriptional regulator [Thermoanaerobacterales bacterium]|nr:CarD family transcriptional regulator [Thermoanaerobacterales bacterium]
MFSIGDKIVYPMHGAGIIEAIEEKEILGEKQKYYIMKLPIGEMKVMVPLDNVDEIGLRRVINTKEFEKVVEVLKDKDITMSSNWNHRYRAHLEKIKSGSIYEVAEVVRNLMFRERKKGLSTSERKMLDNAKQILISELILVKGILETEAEDMLESILDQTS